MHRYNSVAYLLSGVLKTKHSSHLILKIFCFTINASELVLRNKIRFVARIRNVDNCTVALLVIVLLNKKCFLVVLLATVLRFSF